jgi:AraC-like DNA-binding protein
LLEQDAAGHDLGKVASATGVSVSRLSRLFRDESGEGFGSFRRRRRLEQAALLLRQGDMPIWRVAQECGYSSASHFSKVFKGHFGKNPLLWRDKASK